MLSMVFTVLDGNFYINFERTAFGRDFDMKEGRKGGCIRTRLLCHRFGGCM
jgi:hypothetical protein